MTSDLARDLRAAQFHKFRTQHHIVTQIIDADGESVERDEGRGRGEIRRRRFLRRDT